MSDRQTGRTTRQMTLAERGATFVWVNGRLEYPRALAQHLGRSDLRIVAPDWLEVRRGPAHVVVDHAAHLTERQRASYHEYLSNRTPA